MQEKVNERRYPTDPGSPPRARGLVAAVEMPRSAISSAIDSVGNEVTALENIVEQLEARLESVARPYPSSSCGEADRSPDPPRSQVTCWILQVGERTNRATARLARLLDALEV